MPPPQVPDEDQAPLAMGQQSVGREQRNSRARFWAPVAIGGGAGSLPSIAAQIGPDHLSAWANLAITLGSPTLGVISGAIAYAFIRRADRKYEAEAQRGRRGIINALKGDPQRVGGLFYREDTASIEIYRALPRQAVEKPGRPPGPRRPIHPARRNLRAVPDPVEDDPSSLSQRTRRRSSGHPGPS